VAGQLQREVAACRLRAVHTGAALKALAHDLHGKVQHVIGTELASGRVLTVGLALENVHGRLQTK
jgi:hypothetical protein